MRVGAHIGVDVLTRHLPAPLRKAVALFNLGLIGAFLAALLWYGVELTFVSVDRRFMTTYLSFAFATEAAPFGVALLLLSTTGRIASLFRGDPVAGEGKGDDQDEGRDESGTSMGTPGADPPPPEMTMRPPGAARQWAGDGRDRGRTGMILITLIFQVLLLIGMPLGFAIGIAGFTFFVTDPNFPASISAQRIISSTQSFPPLAVPLFVLAGHLMNATGITRRRARLRYPPTLPRPPRPRVSRHCRRIPPNPRGTPAEARLPASFPMKRVSAAAFPGHGATAVSEAADRTGSSVADQGCPVEFDEVVCFERRDDSFQVVPEQPLELCIADISGGNQKELVRFVPKQE